MYIPLLLITCFCLLTGWDSGTDKNWLTPEIELQNKSIKIENPNRYNSNFVIYGMEYESADWVEAAAALYDYAGVQLYLRELTLFDIGEGLTSEEATAKYNSKAEEILQNDPYGIVYVRFDSFDYESMTGISLPYSKWYYGEKAKEFFTPSAIAVWEDIYDKEWELDYDLNEKHICTLSALYAITGNEELIPSFVNDKDIRPGSSSQGGSVFSVFLLMMSPLIFIVLIIVIVVVIVLKKNKLKEMELQVRKAEADSAILEADLDPLEIHDDLLDRYK